MNNTDIGLTTIRWPDDEFQLHQAAFLGQMKVLRKIVKKNKMSVNSYNDDGQTSLFCAAFLGKEDVVEELLRAGADPNFRCSPGGYTALHGACYIGNGQSLRTLIIAGGDLRLLDANGLSPMDWAKRQADPVRRLETLDIIEGARAKVTQTYRGYSSKKYLRRRPWIQRLMTACLGIHFNEPGTTQFGLVSSIQSTGFGHVYFDGKDKHGGAVGIPYIPARTQLFVEKEEGNPSWICGKFTSFIPKVWSTRRTQVTTRELRPDPAWKPNPNILISDLQFQTKLQHPNILLLLGICQADNLETVSLVFERVRFGSLYFLLYCQRQHLTTRYVADLVIQTADALNFIHSKNIIHCGLSSHSIILTGNGLAKLSCFEYAMEDNSSGKGLDPVQHGLLHADLHLAVLRHWMAPEALIRCQFSQRGDIYALCSVIWELCHGDVPWSQLSLSSLRSHFEDLDIGTEPTLPLDKRDVPELWYHVICLGLTADFRLRDLELSEIRDMMALTRTSGSEFQTKLQRTASNN